MILTNPKIVNFLSDKQLLIVENIKSIDLYTISPQLIEGTMDEYSNKNSFVKSLTKGEITTFFNHVLKEDNYDWNSKTATDFNPTIQFVLKGAESQFIVLYDKNLQQLGIIDIEGQETIKVKPELDAYLKKE